jgi:hypothetical protein
MIWHVLDHAGHDLAVLTMSLTGAGSCNRCSVSVIFTLLGKPRKLAQPVKFMACNRKVWRNTGYSD